MEDIIETERLKLRAPQMSDAQRITEFIGDYDVAKMLARAPYPYAIADAKEWLGAIPERVATGRLFTCAIDQNGLIGVLGVHDIRQIEGGKIGELGYWLAKPYWGRGLMSEAASAFVRHAFDALGMAGLISGHLKENHRSGRVLAKLGFRHAGESIKYCLARNREVPHIDVVMTKAQWAEHRARQAA
jgi:RimJ/RimL family protein N-acetyltransferase